MKRFATSSLSIATALFALAGGGLAMGQSQPMQLMSGTAELVHSIDSQSATQGQAVSAKLTGTIETPEGLKLPRGTELLGRVSEVQASHDKSSAKLALVFDKAQMKDGKQVPIKATLVAVAPPGQVAGIPEKVAGDDSFNQEEGEISGVSMQSSVKAEDSGVLMSKDRNIHLDTGTELMIAVAPETGA
jgi:hypothetical protein